jgi:hypothetical protein
LKAIPLLVIPIAVYNLLALLGASTLASVYIPLGYGQQGLSAGSLIVLLGIALLCVEVIKSAYSGRGSVFDQILSILLLVGCTVQLFLFGYARTEWYVLLVALLAVDVVAGLVVALQSNGKDVYVSR